MEGFHSLPANLHLLPIGEIDEHAEQVMVPMRDGIRLATDVYLPAGGGRRAAVLVRLPYDKTGAYTFIPQMATHFTERGYVFVAQDVRGKFRSEGERFAFVHEVADGYDTLEWITGQPFSNGVVGMHGDSYYGFTQWAAAASGHPALRAIAPRVTSATPGSSWWGQGVAPAFLMVEWAASTWIDRWLYEVERIDWSVRPLADAVEATTAHRSLNFELWLRTPPRDPFWTAGIYGDLDPYTVTIPVLHHGGWWDVLQRGQIQDFHTMGRRVGDTVPQHLDMDATDHEWNPLRPDGAPLDDHLDPEGLVRFLPGYVAPALEFFDRYLLGKDTPIPRVRWNLAGVGWREAGSWPPPDARELRLYLADAGRARSGVEGGGLAAQADAAPASATWIHDPEYLVPSLVPSEWAMLSGLPDEREVEARDDVLTFTGEPAARPLDIAGPVSMVASVASTGPSMHVMAKLVDVFPSGRARMIREGARPVAREEFGRPVDVNLGDTGYRLEPGHRLRLEIASSMFPRYVWHPGTDEDPWFATKTNTQDQTLQTGGDTPSYLSIRVVPTT